MGTFGTQSAGKLGDRRRLATEQDEAPHPEPEAQTYACFLVLKATVRVGAQVRKEKTGRAHHSKLSRTLHPRLPGYQATRDGPADVPKLPKLGVSHSYNYDRTQVSTSENSRSRERSG